MISTKVLVTGAALMALSATAAQANLIVNGNFETGTYASWNVGVQSGSNGNLFIVPNNGGNSPISGFPYALNAIGGNFFSITDQSGPGSYSLTQAFTVLTSGDYTISFDHVANNQAGANFANGRDFNTQPNQNAIVDILLGGANPFSQAAGDLVAVLYGPGSDGAGNNPWVHYASTINLAAGTYLFRAAETDNQGFFQQGIDNVVVTAAGAVPEPASWAMMLAGFGIIGGAMRRRQRTSVSFG